MSEVAERAEPYIHDAPSLDPRQRHRFTFDEVIVMVRAGIMEEGAKIELIDGELIDMPPELSPHKRFKNGLGRLFGRKLPESLAVFVDTTLLLGPYNAPEPDVYIFDAALDDEKLSGDDIRLAIEVSDSTLRTDLVRKAQLYARFGLPEYWVVDLTRRVLWVHRDPSVVEEVYRDIREFGAAERVTPLHVPMIDFAIDDLG